MFSFKVTFSNIMLMYLHFLHRNSWLLTLLNTCLYFVCIAARWHIAWRRWWVLADRLTVSDFRVIYFAPFLPVRVSLCDTTSLKSNHHTRSLKNSAIQPVQVHGTLSVCFQNFAEEYFLPRNVHTMTHKQCLAAICG